MGRGKRANVGDETVNANGYTQVKTEDRGWIGKHTLLLEEKLGRKLLPDERAIFKDSNRRNLSPSNIVLSGGENKSVRARIAKLRAEVEDRLALIAELEKQIDE